MIDAWLWGVHAVLVVVAAACGALTALAVLGAVVWASARCWRRLGRTRLAWWLRTRSAVRRR